MEEQNLEWGYDIYRRQSGISFGVCWTYDDDTGENYLYINFWRYSISIGKIWKINKN